VVSDVTVFTKNRNRLLKAEITDGFFSAVVEQARGLGLLSDEHFTVDGTLIEAWAGHKSFKRKDPPACASFSLFSMPCFTTKRAGKHLRSPPQHLPLLPPERGLRTQLLLQARFSFALLFKIGDCGSEFSSRTKLAERTQGMDCQALSCGAGVPFLVDSI
jgi:hypothetical protein